MHLTLHLLLSIALSARSASAQAASATTVDTSPIARRIAVAAGESLFVTAVGSGDPIVIVPGIWSNTYAFRKVTPTLVRAGARVIVIEPLGVSSSSKPKVADYTLAAQSRRIAAVLDTLHVGRALFVGQAASTSMLLRLALDAPARFTGLVSIEGGAVDEQATPGMRRALAVASVLLKIFPSPALLRWRLRGHLEGVSGDHSWITRATLDAYIEPMKREISETITAYRGMAAAGDSVQLAPRLSALSLPVVVLLGDAPHFGGPSAAEIAGLTGRLPHLTVRHVPAAGHLIHEEQPDVILATIAELRRALMSVQVAR